LRILHGLRGAGIEIPFPQRVVHVKTTTSATATTG
jgi:small-conductance mechanosensitive channel